MYLNILFIFCGCLFIAELGYSQWVCSQDSDCSIDVEGSVCINGGCQCAPGKDLVLGGTKCVDISPYHISPCFDDSQCFRLFHGFECRGASNNTEGTCNCQTGFHYFRGRCWRSTDYEESCTNDEECFNIISDPYSMSCNSVCVCADGYYLRQRGECRKIGYAVGDSCMVNEDCQFNGGICNIITRQCENENIDTKSLNVDAKSLEVNTKSLEVDTKSLEVKDKSLKDKTKSLEVNTQSLNDDTNSLNVNVKSVTSRQHGDICNTDAECQNDFICSGVCICPTGYYVSEDGNICYAELGIPSSPEQCVGELAEMIEGVCVCPTHFYYAENMRDCIKAVRTITDSCISDASCHTLGAAASCGPPQEPWGLRSCQCDPETSVWDENRQICRYFSGIGQPCESDSDCLAGELEIQCIRDDSGQGYCACPEGLTIFDGLCITSGLGLGEACQVSAECSIDNSLCNAGLCDCASGYRPQGNVCAPIIGGVCNADSDCLVENTICVSSDTSTTCQCKESYVAYNEECWLISGGYNSQCNVSSQCVGSLGGNSACVDGLCDCQDSYHYRDGNCWPITNLFESCSRSSQCFLASGSERVVCRNSRCECDFEFPYSEELNDCMYSSASTTVSSLIMIIGISIYTLLR